MIVLTTFPDVTKATKFAETIIAEKLAACVQISSPITSIYRWNGEVTKSHEVQVTIKALKESLPSLEQRLAELHSYETPQFIVIPDCKASDRYLAWMKE